MANYAIGDIQGCYQQLRGVLDQAKFDPDNDVLWLAGDLINRGPESLQTLRFIKELGDRASRIILGNHDLNFLAVAYGFQTQRHGDTLAELLAADDCDELVHWLRQQKLVHHCPKLGYTMVHAGIPPMWGIKKALKCSAEVEAVLKDDAGCEKFLLHMYGSEPSQWKKKLKGQDRLRLITNYFTRMRFCNAAGRLEFDIKSGPENAPKNFAPWFSHKKRKTRNDRIVFGHWAALQGKTHTPKVYALDTGCVWGGPLTMMRLEDKQYFQYQL